MLDTAVSRALALKRLRIYERECRRQADLASDSMKEELTKFADTFGRAIDERQMGTNDRPPTN